MWKEGMPIMAADYWEMEELDVTPGMSVHAGKPVPCC
jgi:hypothetical protein